MNVIHPGAFLTLHYRLAGPQGDVVNTFAGPPATFELPEGEVFGQRNPDMIQWLPRKELDELDAPDAAYAVGEVLELARPDGQGTFAGVVLAVRGDGAVQLDFNHPLAGRPVSFEVQIIGVMND